MAVRFEPVKRSRSGAPPPRSPFLFFILVFGLTLPFWIVGAVIKLELMPGLPVAALAVICPAIAALVLSGREGGASAMAALAARTLDFRRIGSLFWYVPILLINPAISVLSFAVMRLTGTNVPAPQIEVLPALALFVVFFLGGLAEELGWSGYVIEPMQSRWGAMRASLLLGVVWVAWHFIPLAEVGRSAAWIAWWSLSTIAARVIMVWLYNGAGRSVFGAALYHAVSNLCWQLFPVQGSYFDPRINSLITAALAAVLVLSPAIATGRRQ